VKVPGDYATVQSAVDSGVATICVAGGTFDEDVHVDSERSVAIIGAGVEATTIGSMWVNFGGLELSYVKVARGVIVEHSIAPGESPNTQHVVKPVRIHDARLRGGKNRTTGVSWGNEVSSSGAALSIVRGDGLGRYGLDVEVAYSDLQASPTAPDAAQNYSGTPGVAAFIVVGARCSDPRGGPYNPCAPVNVSIHDSLVHDSATGIVANDSDDLASSSLRFTGNRIENMNGHAYSPWAYAGAGLHIVLSSNSAATHVSYDGNTVSGNVVGVTVDRAGGDTSTFTHTANHVTGNTTNYRGSARPD
jgi:hypothetical protein